MPNTDTYNKKNFATAQIALHLCKIEYRKNTNPPSDEVLAALLDNRLDENHRQQVLDCIATDADTYNRWSRLVDAVVSAPAELTMNFCDDNRSTTNILKNYFKQNFRNWHEERGDFRKYFEKGIVAASLVLLTFLLIPTQNKVNLSVDLDNLYKEYAVDISTESSKTPELKQAFSSQRSIIIPKKKSEYIEIIETGFLIGAININKEEYKKWGYKLNFFSIVKPSKLQKHTEKEFNLLFELGRLAALTALPCSMNRNSRSIRSFYDLNKSILLLAKDIDNKKIKSILNSFFMEEDITNAVCNFNADIKKLFINK